MFIKEINITGFRSYRELTSIKDFSQRHNVVVGRNGSGKSNFFVAIQFVLSNEYQHLTQEGRHNILHEGTGSRAQLAKVEIVFDNADRRMPTESSEVRIMRQVGQKKDQYFIDNKVVTRTDIVNLMEAAGFSRSNPYYIVKQGKIAELALSADPQRLNLIREVAGTRVFDEKKTESSKILVDTQGKIEKSTTLLSFIEDRLQKLEEEKEDLKEYQKWDKIKRSIEYTIYQTESKEARSKSDKLSAQREQISNQQNQLEGDLANVNRQLQEVEGDIRKLENRYKGMKEERKALLDEETQCLEKKTELELVIKDLQDDVTRERSGRDSASRNLDQLRATIQSKKDILEKITPQYTQLVERESALLTDIRIAEQKCKELNARQGHKDHFRTPEERDAYLNREVHFIDNQITQCETQITSIDTSLREEESEKSQLKRDLTELTVKIDENLSKIESQGNDYASAKSKLDAAVNAQMESSRKEKQVRDTINNVQYEIQQAEQELRRLTSKAIINGTNSVLAVLEQHRQNNNDGRHDKILNGYHGCVIDLFSCEDMYNKAIEVTAEGRLFYHVVEDDTVAMAILKSINEQELRGEVNFFPLNRVVPKPRRDVNDTEARTMLSVMQYEQKFEKVFCAIFANTVFVRNLAAGSRVAKNENFDCVTLEGDQVSRRGPMTGGYIDVKKSKLELARKLRNLSTQQTQLLTETDAISSETNKCTDEVERVRANVSKIEIDVNALRQEHRLMTEKSRNIKELLNRRNLVQEPKNAQILQLTNRIRELKAHKETVSAQIGTEFKSHLSENEQQSINRLQDDVKVKKKELEGVVKNRIEVENKKASLENELQSNLLKKRENLEAKIQDISVEEKRDKLKTEQAEIKLINDRLSSISNSLRELDTHLFEYEKDNEQLTQKLEECQDQKSRLNSRIEELAKSADVICTKMSSIQAKRDENLRKVCVDELKKNEQAIKDLLNVLENRRYETLQLTFKQVAKNFHEVFKQLIPQGRADLIMKTSDAGQDSSGSGPAEAVNIMERFVGIGIQVSFTGTGDSRELSHLSGGQKTLVALALIFAIQKCDPAPFYLFDEIDAALDQEHRKSVADMIHELSENAQFITTTFRQELLEHAENYYGVRFRNKVSYIDRVSRETAYDFIEDDQTHS
ncbi:SMC proteins flexible hinge domain-containing protein [Ditylenchus destructor]|nr:SMC proteins flexible hinge domain-containing protein [Ditylenchus destructor]